MKFNGKASSSNPVSTEPSLSDVVAGRFVMQLQSLHDELSLPKQDLTTCTFSAGPMVFEGCFHAGC